MQLLPLQDHKISQDIARNRKCQLVLHLCATGPALRRRRRGRGHSARRQAPKPTEAEEEAPSFWGAVASLTDMGTQPKRCAMKHTDAELRREVWPGHQ